MFLESIRLEGYSSFLDFGIIAFGPGLNIVIGENNSGKSAVLQSIGPSFLNNRHRSNKEYRPERLPAPKQTLVLRMSGDELLGGALRYPRQMNVPITSTNSVESDVRGLFTAPELRFYLSRQAGAGFDSLRFPSHGLFRVVQRADATSVTVNVGDGKYATTNSYVRGADNLADVVGQMFQNDVFSFSAQRYSVGRSPFSNPPRLESGAQNLPAILNKLKGERPAIFDDLLLDINEVLPNVRSVSVIPSESNELEVRVWPTSDQSDLNLSFPLNDLGDGRRSGHINPDGGHDDTTIHSRSR